VSTGEDERAVRAHGVDLYLQTFGDPSGPRILLIAGSAASMLQFPEELCERLAAHGRYVNRYDHRDTGRSVNYPIGDPPYTGRDLAEDALGIPDPLAIERAHLVGVSMGGGTPTPLDEWSVSIPGAPGGPRSGTGSSSGRCRARPSRPTPRSR
jgi:alpha-beta hydrolase superfamily lysophospholipase